MNATRQTGFTLIEVLIALVVLSIGLLGLAGLQTTGLQNNHSAYLRSQATLLAYDIADRMRANRAAIATDTYHSKSASSASAIGGCTSTGGCTPTELAENDLNEWYNAVTNQLPGGEAVVCLDNSDPPASGSPDDGTPGSPSCSGGGSVYTAKIWWDDERDSGTKKRFVMSFRP